MNKKHILIICAILGFSLSLFAQVPLSKTAVGLHLGAQSGSGYSMRFFGPQHGLQVTLGALTWGSDDPYFPDRQYYWYNDKTGMSWYPEQAPQDTLVTFTEVGRTLKASLGLNHIWVLDTFDVFGLQDHGRLYMMTGGSYEFHRQTEFSKQYRWVSAADSLDYAHYEPVNNAPPTEESKIEHRWTAGIGLGVDIAISKNFRGALEVPITYNWDNRISYTPQIGIYYYFK